ncbi:MAG TPA: hypothetical protein VMC10_08820 [Stellaceae bacterium]|nr:hypothetical protein [Stellaceae bacterium]
MTVGYLRMAVLAAAAVLVAAPSAFAFQIVGPSQSGGVSGSNFTDPDQKSDNWASKFQSGGDSSNMRTMKFGSTTLQFGGGAVDNYGPSPALRDRFLQNPAARTVPSEGW